MRTRIPITAEEILKALEASGGDVGVAASTLDMSERTLYRRMRDFGIRARVRYVPAGEAA